MKKSIQYALLLILSPLTLIAQNITVAYENAIVTNDGTDDFYEVDVFLSSDTDFILGEGQFLWDYNTAAFGEFIWNNGNLEYLRPANSILGSQTFAVDNYSGFVANDQVADRTGYAWTQFWSGGTIGINVSTTPVLLLRIKVKYTNLAEDPGVCFNTESPRDDQFKTACGPFAPGPAAADCNNEDGMFILDYLPECEGAALPVEVCTGGVRTWNTATGWDGTVPDNTMTAIINGLYVTGDEDNLDVCELFITASGSLTVTALGHALVQNNISNEGTLIVEHTASIVQVNNDATVSNTGIINVNVTTPLLKPRDFMVLGTPMTADIPVGLDNPISKILKHSTIAFRPHPDVQVLFPGGTNFVDEDNNDWSNHTSNFNPSEGYVVRPQESLTDGNKTYDLLFSGGTLNNGLITYASDYNTTGTGTGTPAMNKNASPSILSNPYPSAISASDFRVANDAVDEVYFWEHNTTPNNEFPGANSSNFNMADISTHNATGFNPASTGSPTPPTGGDFFISTGQGFGFKNNGATTGTGQNITFVNAMRRVDNNNTLRTTDNKDNIWLKVNNSQYKLSSSILIGFTNAATPDFDAGYDSERLGAPVSLYSHLLDGTAALGIQGRESFDFNAEVGIGFSSQIDQDDAQYSISIMDIIGDSMKNATVYLKDNQTGYVANISEAPYTFTSSIGTFNNRFTLQFKDKQVLTTSDNLDKTISIFPNPTNDYINILSVNNTIISATIYDMRGRLITQKIFSSENNNIDLSALKSAVYFIKLNTLKGSVVKRIIKM